VGEMNMKLKFAKTKKVKLSTLRNCLTCKKEFKPKYNSQKYCSYNCSAKATNNAKGKKWTLESRYNRKKSGNPSWKGNKVGYSGVHTWIKRNWERKGICELCGSNRYVDWHNKDKKYTRNRNDWEELCRKCHMKEDGRINKPKLPKNFKPIKSTLKRKADDAFGKLVRSKGFCELAGKDHIHCGGTLQTMHIITRSNLRLRYDFKNVLCGCGGHHVWYTHNPSAFDNFIQNNFPDKWKYIMDHKNEKQKMTAEDYKKIIEEFNI
jgi:hypothetical protein